MSFGVAAAVILFFAFGLFFLAVRRLIQSHVKNNKIPADQIKTLTQKLSPVANQLNQFENNLDFIVTFIDRIQKNLQPSKIQKVSHAIADLPNFHKCIKIDLDTVTNDVGLAPQNCSGLGITDSLACVTKNGLKKLAKDEITTHILTPIKKAVQTPACAQT